MGRSPAGTLQSAVPYYFPILGRVILVAGAAVVGCDWGVGVAGEIVVVSGVHLSLYKVVIVSWQVQHRETRVVASCSRAIHRLRDVQRLVINRKYVQYHVKAAGCREECSALRLFAILLDFRYHLLEKTYLGVNYTRVSPISQVLVANLSVG